MTTTSKKLISKQVDTHLHTSKNVYLLGTDEDGIKYWLEAASWDCEWYWGFGYVETYNLGGKRKPSSCTDIQSHQHIDSSFMGKHEFYNHETHKFEQSEYIHNIFDSPKLAQTTFTENEGWKLSELFNTFYKLKEFAALYHSGGSGTSTNPLQSILKNEAQENHINKVLLPKVFEEIYKILNPA